MQPNHTHPTNDIAAAAEEARFLIRVASRAARDDVAEGSNRHKRGVQNQNEDARSSWIVAPSQPAMGFTTNAQVNQVASPSRLPLSSLQHLAPLPTVSFQAIFDPPAINMALVVQFLQVPEKKGIVPYERSEYDFFGDLQWVCASTFMFVPRLTTSGHRCCLLAALT